MVIHLLVKLATGKDFSVKWLSNEGANLAQSVLTRFFKIAVDTR